MIGRAGDRDPFVAGAGDLAGAVAGPPVGDGLGAVEVDPADVGLVAQQPVQGGGAPQARLPVGEGTASALSRRQIWRMVMPAARSAKIRRTTAASGS